MKASDAVLARNLMVDGQLRPSRVNDKRILDAMRRLPREAYVPAHLGDLVYIDGDVPLGGGRVLLKPLTIARLVQLARPLAGEAALVIGAGTGYGAALLRACGLHVTALEDDAALLAIAQATPPDPDAIGSITYIKAPIAAGHPPGAPYDLVVIEGAVRDIPPILGSQVGAHGRLVCIVCPPAGPGVAVLAEPSLGGLRAQPEFDANAPLLPQLAAAAAFSF